MKWTLAICTSLVLTLAIMQGCMGGGRTPTAVENPVVTRQTIEGVGACQGVFVHEGSVWMYGDDKDRGVIKRLEWSGPDVPDGPHLVDVGEKYKLKLYRDYSVKQQPDMKLPSEPIPHPTGLTHHDDYGTFIGNTVDQKGTIFHITWWGFKQSGSLDTWIQNVIEDDLAKNGTRPEFVRWNGRWLIATADYGDAGNALRLYDPEKLKKAKKTSDPGVLVAEFQCGPFVQSMHWIDEENTLVLAQNQVAGLRYRLTLLKFGEGDTPPRVERMIDLGYPEDELEGFAILEPGWHKLNKVESRSHCV
ncbi:MAG: hypothetical protein AAF711_10005, partial [Planctomycetota bacterium]